MLRPRERRIPQMPNHTPVFVEQRVIAYSLGPAGEGPKRIAAELARLKWGGIRISPNGVYRVLRRHGLETAAKRLALIAGTSAPPEPQASRPLWTAPWPGLGRCENEIRDCFTEDLASSI